MTMIITVLVGAGSLLLMSAIEGKSIQETFQRILRGESATATATESYSLSSTPQARTGGGTLDRGFYAALGPASPSYL